ncbi:MAG: integration host factor, actinobacterial type [bacterium]|nr:integration host factor, actinobacterial type [bacterium]MCY3924325.1 integration host factor, actinobacterial type [bacterium]
MPLPPQLSDAQRQEALAKAAAVRRRRAELKDRLKIGDLTLADVLDMAADDDVVGGTKVLAVLESMPRIGKVTARRLMEELDISETRRLRGLGVKQREALLARLS